MRTMPSTMGDNHPIMDLVVVAAAPPDTTTATRSTPRILPLSFRYILSKHQFKRCLALLLLWQSVVGIAVTFNSLSFDAFFSPSTSSGKDNYKSMKNKDLVNGNVRGGGRHLKEVSFISEESANSEDYQEINPDDETAVAATDSKDMNGEKRQIKNDGMNPSKGKQQLSTHKKRQYPPIPKYRLEHALSIFDIFDGGAALFVYDPAEDLFYTVYPESMIWEEESRFARIRTWVFHSLRLMFPDRFNPNSKHEFVLPIASMDYPQVKYEQLDCFMDRNAEHSCVPKNFPPILQFGSVFQSPKIPSTIPMPMPEKNHLGCFHQWLVKKDVCKMYQEKSLPSNPLGLVFGDTVGLGWDDLIPQVVWRATDRGYLSRMVRGLRRPNFDEDIKPKLKGAKTKEEKRNAAIEAMHDVYDELAPRWKGVVWTAEAERDAMEKGGDENSLLPWCNIKYATTYYMKGVDDSEYYNQLMEFGIPAIGEAMDLATLAKYKYHMDIGGGGGTTWSGTFEKLAMPGVLFHHVTPTKDYNHARIEPWVHYIPLDEDMKDLKEKYEWAESHPKEARAISERATAFIRSLGTEDGFGDFFDEFYREPLQQVVDAYTPLSSGNGDNNSSSWQSFVKSKEKRFGGARPMIRCEGRGYRYDCEKDLGEDDSNKQNGWSPLIAQLEVQDSAGNEGRTVIVNIRKKKRRKVKGI